MEINTKPLCAWKGCPDPRSASLSKCSRCEAVAYCSRECQKQDWPTHKTRCCKGLRGTQEAELVNATKTMLERLGYTRGLPDIGDIMDQMKDIDIPSCKGRRAQRARKDLVSAVLTRFQEMPDSQQRVIVGMDEFLKKIGREESQKFMDEFRDAQKSSPARCLELEHIALNNLPYP